MSRTVGGQRVIPSFQPPIPENNPVTIPLLSQPKGMRPGIAGELRDPDLAYQIDKLQYETGGVLASAITTVNSTNILSGSILSIFSYGAESARIQVAAATTGFYYRVGDGGSFLSMTGPAIVNVFEGDYFHFVTWGKGLICTNPVVGMYEINLEDFTYEKLDEAPQDAQFVSVFNGRLVATMLDGNRRRVQWSVKFDSSDWTGLGSGFEDLLPTNAISENPPLRAIPIDDRKAYLFRSDSCMLMSATDNFDVPFLFSEMHANLPCRSPRTVVNTRSGVVSVGPGDVFLVTTSSIDRIGIGLVSSTLERSAVDPTFGVRAPTSRWIGKYNPNLDEYWLSTDYTMFRYQFGYQAWVEYSFGTLTYPPDMAPTMGVSSGTYADLSGTYAAQIGTLDSNVSDVYRSGMIVAKTNTAYLLEATTASSGAISGSTITTNDIDLVNRDKLITITEFEIKFQVYNTNRLITVSYSFDRGATYTQYGTISSSASVFGGMEVHTISKVLTGQQVRFKIDFAASAKFRVFEMNLIGIEGAKQMHS